MLALLLLRDHSLFLLCSLVILTFLTSPSTSCSLTSSAMRLPFLLSALGGLPFVLSKMVYPTSPALPDTTSLPRLDCTDVTVDFSTDSDGVPLEPGTYVHDEWGPFGLMLSATGGIPDKPRLFDTANPGTVDAGDPDLGSPNMLCTPPGPGEGAGGEPGAPGENCRPLGNVLIIQEDNANPSIPDDNGSGGTLVFDFVNQAYVYDIGFLALSRQSSLTIVHVTDLGMEETVIDLTSHGNNAMQKQVINMDKVEQVKLDMAASGAVTHISFCYTPNPRVDPTDRDDFEDLSLTYDEGEDKVTFEYKTLDGSSGILEFSGDEVEQVDGIVEFEKCADPPENLALPWTIVFNETEVAWDTPCSCSCTSSVVEAFFTWEEDSACETSGVRRQLKSKKMAKGNVVLEGA